MKESRFAATRCFSGRTLVNHSLTNQFLYQSADYASGHVQMAREVSPRDRLMFPNYVESNAPVDVPRGGAGSDVKISGVDLANGGAPLLFEKRTISPHRFGCQDLFEFFFGRLEKKEELSRRLHRFGLEPYPVLSFPSSINNRPAIARQCLPASTNNQCNLRNLWPAFDVYGSDPACTVFHPLVQAQDGFESHWPYVDRDRSFKLEK
jgi:hypothetical protein